MRVHTGIMAIAAGAVLVVGAAAQNRSGVNDADQKELYNYVLTMDKIQKIGNATKALEVLAKQHPEIQSEDNAKTIDDTVKKFQKYPEAVAAISKNGMSPREYTVGVMVVIQAGMAVGFKKSGTYKEYPPEMLKLVSRANLDFTEQHWDEIQKLTNSSSDK